VTFGLFETTTAVAFVAGDFGTGTEILKSGFDGVNGITVIRSYLKRLKGQAGKHPITPGTIADSERTPLRLRIGNLAIGHGCVAEAS
jgi:hypothetical protein